MIPEMNTYEVVQSHEYQDIYRIQYGVLLIVNKHEKVKNGWLYESKFKGKVKKVSGISKCFTTTEEITDTFYNITWPINTILLNGSVIAPITDADNYWIELKFSGGALEGTMADHAEFQSRVNEILDKYKKEVVR